MHSDSWKGDIPIFIHRLDEGALSGAWMGKYRAYVGTVQLASMSGIDYLLWKDDSIYYFSKDEVCDLRDLFNDYNNPTQVELDLVKMIYPNFPVDYYLPKD